MQIRVQQLCQFVDVFSLHLHVLHVHAEVCLYVCGVSAVAPVMSVRRWLCTVQ